jgi:hypothetical protein
MPHEVELAILGNVHWHNTARLAGYLDDIPPAELEAASAPFPRARTRRS